MKTEKTEIQSNRTKTFKKMTKRKIQNLKIGLQNVCKISKFYVDNFLTSWRLQKLQRTRNLNLRLSPSRNTRDPFPSENLSSPENLESLIKNLFMCLCLVGGRRWGAHLTLVSSYNFENLHFLKTRKEKELEVSKNEIRCRRKVAGGRRGVKWTLSMIEISFSAGPNCFMIFDEILNFLFRRCTRKEVKGKTLLFLSKSIHLHVFHLLRCCFVLAWLCKFVEWKLFRLLM